jgi:hypothetical protein
VHVIRPIQMTVVGAREESNQAGFRVCAMHGNRFRHRRFGNISGYDCLHIFQAIQLACVHSHSTIKVSCNELSFTEHIMFVFLQSARTM